MESNALRHIVMIKVADKENIVKMLQKLEILGEGIPGVQWNTFTVNTDIGISFARFNIACFSSVI